MIKLGFHAAHEERWAAIGRVLVCGLIFCVLLSAIPVGAAASEVVSFPDAGLESAVREALSKPEGDITADDMATLTHLHAETRGISDLSGLEYAVNLQTLELYNNQISDLSPLAGLTNLRALPLYNNQISDLSPLASLTNLGGLYLSNNQISDLSPLAGLTNLQQLHLDSNQISDISPLAGLTNLRMLWLHYNRISDIGPLVANSGLGSTDIVRLEYNYLYLGSTAMNDIQTLQGREVWVTYDPQYQVTTYTLDLAVNPEGGGTVTGAGAYAAGDMVSVTATAAEGYTFAGWTDGAGNTVSTEASFGYTMPEGDVTLTANFEAATYTLDLAVSPESGGTVTGAGTYAAGNTVSITATPNDGYTFAGWTDGAGNTVSTEASFDYTMSEGDTTLTANFDAVTYTLDLAVNPEGSGTVTGSGTYAAGETASITATPNDGYTFAGWTDGAGNTVSTSATFDYTMPEGDTTLTANFETNFERQFEVQWLPPVTNEEFVLQDGTTLPLKFRLVDETGAVVREVQEGISLRIEGVGIWELGDGGSALRFNDGQYTANFHTRNYDSLGSELTATVRGADGSELGSIMFEVSAEKGVGRGNGKQN